MVERVNTDILLFDLDGTLVKTTIAVEKAFGKLCDKYGLNLDELLKFAHGTRTTEVLAKKFPMIDNTNEVATIEFETSIGKDYVEFVSLVPGCFELLNSLQTMELNYLNKGSNRWAIVTSGTSQLTHSWFNNILKSINKPEVFITSSDVTKGKPDPQGYLMAKNLIIKRLNLKNDAKSIVFEDAPVGIQAGVASGSIVVGITTAFDKQLLIDAGATYVVSDLSKVKVIKDDINGIELEIDCL
ncbi:hypothetical protein CANARDRAFT_25968 [[Candida] arabinofermentans NRRL YB-2248]|uniref:Uncharacterized protein n=1 Tax=[Candida] arabinofermentans NRRL YB-2248 TaxID=983967 RepID=A0A1E4T7W8_9ASCO|nr:hypothetical protein CANARDRAFT_25968 [[Candida] arabinofermentans NRRL YB-2248]